MVTLLVQSLPFIVNFNTYIWISNKRSGHYQRLFNPPDSPLIWHPRIWSGRVHEWWMRIAPPHGAAILTDGFSYSEGDRSQGDLLPRWSYADAQIQIVPQTLNAPLDGTIVVGDHRPWPLERAQFDLLLNGQPLEDMQRIDMTGQNVIWELSFHIPTEQLQPKMLLTLHSDTWNPENTTPDNPRDEDLGVRVEQIAFTQQDRSLTIYEALPIPTIQKDRREMWLWYYDTPKHHLFDAWLWFLFVAGLPAGTIVLLLLLVAAPASVMVAVGGRGVWNAGAMKREER